jgi:protein gp37
MNKTKIDWADMTWNPVTGCKHGCPYCYARNEAQRFGGNLENKKPEKLNILLCPRIKETKKGKLIKGPFPFYFEPTLYRYRLDEPQHTKQPQTIFVCSMADLFGDWIPDEWIKEVFEACKEAPQHRYLFLTKNPVRYIQFRDPIIKGAESWIGQTITGTEENKTILYGPYAFVSIEPILAPIDKSVYQDVGWVIIGAETGNRKGKVIPKCEWIEEIVKECRTLGIPIFMKKSLVLNWGEPLIQEYPWKVAT